MRNAFADEMTRICGEDRRAVLLSGDIGNKLFDRLKAAAPGGFLNCGVAEANMIGMAAGLAMSGFRPVAYTITPFITTRVLEQIRIDLCYHNVPVTVVGVGGGLSYAALGPTHHSLEDVAILRSLPNMTVLCPGDAMEARSCVRAALAHDGPVYIRLGKKGEPVVHQAPPEVGIGRGIEVRSGRDVAILALGNILPEAMAAAETLADLGISAGVVSVVSAKPLDTAGLGRVFDTVPLVVTVEEHSLVGGYGAAVAEWLADRTTSSRAALLRLGTPDSFFCESGSQRHARRRLGLDAAGIAARIAQRLGRAAATPAAGVPVMEAGASA